MSKQSHSSLRNVLDQLHRRRHHSRRNHVGLIPEALEPRQLLSVSIDKIKDEVVGHTAAAVSVNYGLSSSDPQAFIGGVWVDWGDGPTGTPDTAEVFSNGETMTHMYSTPGKYTVNAYEVESGTYWTSSDTYTDSTTVYAIAAITPKPILSSSNTGPTGGQGPTPIDPPATNSSCPTTNGVDPEPAVNAPIPGVTSTGFDPEFNDVFDFQQEYTTEPDIPVGFLSGGGDQLTPNGQPIIPYLAGAYDPNTEGFMYGVVTGANVYWFQSSGSEYYLGWKPDNTFTEMYDYGWTLQYPSTLSPESPTPAVITVTEVSGMQLLFNPIFTEDGVGPRGSLYEAIAPNGDTLTPSYSGVQMSAVTMTTSDGTTETDQKFSLSHSDGYISDIGLQRRSYAVGGTPPDYTDVQQAAYTYYDGSTSYGALGQLQTVTIEDGSGNPEQTSYYRYYNTDGIGYDSLLELYLSGPSYDQASAALPSGTTPLTATLAQLQPYADRYYTYEGTDVNTMVAQGEGCSSCSGGEGTYTYSYSYNSTGGSEAYNTWLLKTTITLPDETQQVDYYDQYGLEMLQVNSDGTHMQGWFTEYDDQGRVMLIAEPSAVNLPSDLSTIDANPDLLNKVDGSYQYLSNSTGQIETISYYSGETANATAAGSVAGYMSDWYLQEGQNGTPIHQEHLTYYDFSYGDPWVHVYPIGADTVYGNTDGTDDTRTTSYHYSTYSETSRIESMETTYPTISSSQNGPDEADVVHTYYDTYGLPIWTKDANGNVNYTAYDIGTGAVVETITDVKYSDLTSDQKSSFDLTGWTDPTSGLNLVTTYQVDGLGRTIEETDPGTYDNMVLGSGPVAFWPLGESSGTTAADASGNGQDGTYTGSLTLGGTGPIAGSAATSAAFTSSGYVTIPDSAALELTGDLTLEAWIDPTNFSSYRGIVSKTNSNLPAPFDLYLASSTGLPTLVLGNGTSYQVFSATTAPATGTWSDLAVTISGSTVTFYLNGVADGTGTITVTRGDTGSPVRIGERSDGGTSWVGSLADVALYNTTLSATQIAAHYQAGNGSDPGSVTYTVYDDPNHETRVYPGWQSATGQATSTGTTTTLVDTALSGSVNYAGYTILITSGTDSGQTESISAYNGSTHTLTFSSAMSSATDSTSHFVLGGTTGPIEISQSQLWGALLSGQATADGTTTTLIDTTHLSTAEDYVGYTLIVTGGTDDGQTAVVTGYDPSTQTLTFSAGLTAATDMATQYTLNALYSQTLTSSATPTVNGDDQPTGEETFAASNVQSLSRDLANAAGQVIEADSYFSLAGTTYSTSAAQLGTASNNSASGNYHPTLYSYDALGRQDKVVSPTGTITRTIYDWVGRVSSVWVGTDDTPESGYWSPTNPSNMIDVEDYYYDQRPAGPTAPTLGQTSTMTSAAATYYVVITYVTPNNESVASAEASYSVSADYLLTVAAPAASAGATGYNVYVSTSGGQEQLQNSTPIALTSGWTESSSGLVAGANAPTAVNTVGNSDLTETVQHPDTTAADDRVTLNLYDWRDRLIATKQGAMLDSDGNPDPSGETDSAHRLISYNTYDNLGEATSSRTYAGDEVNLNDFANWTSSTDSSDLRAYSTQSYDAQGRVYLAQTYSVDPSSGTVGSSLAANYYYDLNGNLIADSDPGGQVTKHSYDGANRDIVNSITDGGVINGATQDWATADTTEYDVVIEQTDNTYDADGSLIETEDQQRFDSDSTSSTGALGGPTSGINSRNYYMAYYYDAADRLIAEENVGTNGGTSWTRPGAPDDSDLTHLVTTYGYDTAGNQATVTDPKGIVTQSYFDGLGRTTETIADYTDGTPTNDTNQTTTCTYDGDNNVLTMTAVMPSGTNSQTTAYIYNDTGGTVGTNLFSKDLLVKIEYPSASTGDASTTSTDDQSYSYDNLGEELTFTDQNGTTHSYGYDVLGRLTSDTATTIGSGVDSTVRRLGYSFNDAGLPFKQTSYYNTSGTSVANQVENVYNGYGQMIIQYQADAGSVNTSTTPKVQYGYNVQEEGDNFSRQISLTYPDGRVVNYNYDGNDLDDAISRLSSMSDSGGSIESYSYLGLSTIVREIRPGSVLTYVMANGGSPGDAGDIYIGLDRFGRVVDQLWATSDTTDGTSGDTLGTITDQFEYGYDQNSNVLYKDNMVHAADSELYHANSSASGDDSTAYDPLNRITAFRRGTLSLSAGDNNGTTLDTVTTASATNSWSYDALGNSTETGSTSRGFNSKNQITSYGGSSTITYDHDGNMTTDQAGNTYEYDAWNRLVYVDLPGLSSNESFTYNAGGERPGITVCNGATTTSYYSTQWQDLEDDIVVSGECGDTTTKSTYLWSEAYIDELVARDTSVNGGSVTRVYAQQDANHDVTSLTNSSGTVLERFIYDPYGTRTVLNASWSTTSDGYSWVYGFQGGRLDPLNGLINFRNRDLNPSTGTWMEQDPAGYVDGLNMYRANDANPIIMLDPFGTCPCDDAKAARDLANGILAQLNKLKQHLNDLYMKSAKLATQADRDQNNIDRINAQLPSLQQAQTALNLLDASNDAGVRAKTALDTALNGPSGWAAGGIAMVAKSEPAGWALWIAQGVVSAGDGIWNVTDQDGENAKAKNMLAQVTRLISDLTSMRGDLAIDKAKSLQEAANANWQIGMAQYDLLTMEDMYENAEKLAEIAERECAESMTALLQQGSLP